MMRFLALAAAILFGPFAGAEAASLKARYP
jgi:hypothetical protein